MPVRSCMPPRAVLVTLFKFLDTTILMYQSLVEDLIVNHSYISLSTILLICCHQKISHRIILCGNQAMTGKMVVLSSTIMLLSHLPTVVLVPTPRRRTGLTAAPCNGGVPPLDASGPVHTWSAANSLAGAPPAPTCPRKTDILANEPSSVRDETAL